MIDKLVLRVPAVMGARRFNEDFEKLVRKCGYQRRSRGYETPFGVLSLAKTGQLEDLKVETNLAKLLLGHNVCLLRVSELWQAATRLASEVEMFLDVRLPSVERWEVSSAEMAYDWIVTDPSAYVMETLRIAHQRSGHRRHLFTTAGPAGGSTFAFGPRVGGGRIYDKEAELEAKIRSSRRSRDSCNVAFLESLRPLAKGRLRVEFVVGSSQLKGWLMLPEPFLGALLDDLSEDPFGYVATRWRALVRSWDTSEYRAATARLRAAYPSGKARSLVDAWVHIQVIGLQEYRDSAGVNRSTIKRMLDDFKVAGVELGSRQSLEPIEIHRVFEDW